MKRTALKDIQIYEFVKGNIEEDLSKADIWEKVQSKFPDVKYEEYSKIYSEAFTFEFQDEG